MAEGKNFRNASWGMDVNDVRKSENADEIKAALENEDKLFYKGRIVGCDCHIFYDFTKGVLTQGTYIIDELNDENDVTAYEELVKLLTKKYGEPLTSEIESNHRYKKIDLKAYEELAEAVASGAVTMRSSWVTPDTNIYAYCKEDTEKHNAIVYVVYIRKEQEAMEEEYEGDMNLI